MKVPFVRFFYTYMYNGVMLVMLIVELGVIIGKTGRDIPASRAEEYIAGRYTTPRHAAGMIWRDACK